MSNETEHAPIPETWVLLVSPRGVDRAHGPNWTDVSVDQSGSLRVRHDPELLPNSVVIPSIVIRQLLADHDKRTGNPNPDLAELNRLRGVLGRIRDEYKAWVVGGYKNGSAPRGALLRISRILAGEGMVD